MSSATTTANLAVSARTASPTVARSTYAAIGALTLLAFVLRVAGIDQSLLGDELFAYAEIHDQSPGGVITQLKDSVEVSPPLYFVLAWASAQIGDPTVWIRLPSLILGTALVPLTYALGARTIGNRPALFAAALLTLSPFAIFYGTEARPYATLAFCAVLSTLLLLYAIDSGRWWWAAYALASSAVIYSHYTGIFVLATQATWAVLAHRERFRQIALVNLGVAVLYLPWLSQVRGKGQLDVYGPFSVSMSLLGRPLKGLVGHPLVELSEIPGSVALAVIAVVVLGALGALVLFTGRSPGSGVTLIVALALCTPLGMLLAAAVVGNDLFIVRNFSASTPAGLLCLAALLSAAPGRLGTVLPAVAVLAVGVGTLAILSPDNQRTNAREVARLLDAQAAPTDPIVTVAPTDTTSNRPLDPYLRQPHVRVFGDAAGYPSAFRGAAESGAKVFVVFPDVPEVRPLIRPPGDLAGRYRLVAEHRFPGFSGGLAVREFSPRP